jgi:3-isopropylmalate/(R)-2-methylmalate dehydratase small subunit
LNAFRLIRSRTAVLPAADVDTDQIIPARFLTSTERDGFGGALFADWRYDAAGQPRPDFVLNQPGSAGCTILVAGRNFGCGSSREHAPWALLEYGIRAVISSSFADIFRGNSLKNGLLPVQVDEPILGWLMDHPGTEVTVDLEATSLTLADGRRVDFPIEAFARHCLLHGIDELGYLLSKTATIDAWERARPR